MPEHTQHDIAEAQKLQNQLKAIFQSHPGGRADAATLLRVRALCALASRSVGDSYLKAKMGQVEHYADALFSDRKHQRWARQPLSGAMYLRRQVFAVLGALDTRLHDMVGMRQAERSAAAQSQARDSGRSL
jgi:hypothetical protein